MFTLQSNSKNVLHDYLLINYLVLLILEISGEKKFLLHYWSCVNFRVSWFPKSELSPYLNTMFAFLFLVCDLQTVQICNELKCELLFDILFGMWYGLSIHRDVCTSRRSVACLISLLTFQLMCRLMELIWIMVFVICFIL